MGKNVLLVGATGLVGKVLLYQLIENEAIVNIHVLSRRPMTIKHKKVIVHETDFTDLDKNKEAFKVDAIFCCIGTTIAKAGSQQAFRKVDYDIPVLLSNLGHAAKVSSMHVVSAMGADKNASIFYNKVKGEMEESIINSDISHVCIYRPSLLLGNRNEFRMGEFIAQKMLKPLRFLFAGPLTKYKPVEAKQVAKAMLNNFLLNKQGIEIIENDHIFNLAE
jgi:uncharacterized protein YbjT (DUF2867 family)